MLQGQELVNKAYAIAVKAHENQYRRNGKTPYITHPLAVAMKFKSPILKSIGYLHDVLEDSNITITYLFKQKIPTVVIDTVVLLTKLDDEKYLDYILKIKNNSYATLVKIEDIKHNYPTTHKSKQERYDMALYILKEDK